jgi:hypothetical protein
MTHQQKKQRRRLGDLQQQQQSGEVFVQERQATGWEKGERRKGEMCKKERIEKFFTFIEDFSKEETKVECPSIFTGLNIL